MNKSAPDKNLELIAFFGAVSMFFAAIEFLFPKPLPFLRLGLANIPIILALRIFNFKELMILTIIKVAGQGIVNGTLASYVFIFSALGSVFSMLTMFALDRTLKSKISLIGISVGGALASNSVQTVLSLFVIFGKNAWVIIPYFMGIGLAAGIAVGFFAERFNRKSEWFAHIKQNFGAVNAS